MLELLVGLGLQKQDGFVACNLDSFLHLLSHRFPLFVSLHTITPVSYGPTLHD